MREIVNWIKNNYEWFFGGIGATILITLVGYFFKNNKEVSTNQKQKSSGDSSTNLQIGQINNDKN